MDRDQVGTVLSLMEGSSRSGIARRRSELSLIAARNQWGISSTTALLLIDASVVCLSLLDLNVVNGPDMLLDRSGNWELVRAALKGTVEVLWEV